MVKSENHFDGHVIFEALINCQSGFFAVDLNFYIETMVFAP